MFIISDDNKVLFIINNIYLNYKLEFTFNNILYYFIFTKNIL